MPRRRTSTSQPEELEGVEPQDALPGLLADRQALEIRLEPREVEAVRAVKELVAAPGTVHEGHKLLVERRREVGRYVAVHIRVAPDHGAKFAGPRPAGMGHVDLEVGKLNRHVIDQHWPADVTRQYLG